MRTFRLVLILVIGAVVIYMTGETINGSSFADILIWLQLLVAGFLLIVWSIIGDYRTYRREKKILCFSTTFLCLLFIAISVGLGMKIQSRFHKPTLLKVYYEDEFNTSIDFKADGTYIFDHSGIMSNNYFYGTYRIKGNSITMDTDTINNLGGFRYLEIKEAQEGETDWYLYQVDSLGKVTERSQRYKVTVDHRKP